MTLLENLWLGFLLTALPGPVFFEVIRRQLSDRSSVVSFLFGNYTGVAIIAVLALTGLVFITEYINQNTFYLVSGAVLVYIGVSSIFSAGRQTTTVKPARQHAYTLGLILSLANPVSVAFWMSIVGKFYAETDGYALPWVYSLVVIVGGVLCFVLLIILLNRFGRFIKPGHVVLLSWLFGLILLGYGLMNIVQAIV